ncbi:hypothetical protein [Natrarchaeobaculum sulfurireducens]|uniref:Uncharacterized protein n=1 Tax=Natrarchaeobaculum sulfurireducens TaxID=2044521 RepID=A0A346PJ12_9EURY|nr:hypothetical protein [Natrarchaeobaculum sulfurireducens]AXR79507.1 hypothetical protein AArc1_3202 [Natrarchaeobaculum sulfurireducens]
MYRAADDDGVSYGQIDRAVRTIDDLDGPAKTRAERLVRQTDGDGLRLIDELDGDSLQRVLDLDIDRATEFRSAAARNHGQGVAATDDVDAFARHADDLQGVDGLNSGPVEDFITAGDPGNVQGAVREVRRADEIGAANIERMDLEVYDGKRQIGELDIQRTNGEVVESKSTFGYSADEIDTQFDRKLQTMMDHDDVAFDGNAFEVRATQVGDEDLVRSKVAEWENRVANSGEWNNAEVTIRVVDESDGSVITN